MVIVLNQSFKLNTAYQVGAVQCTKPETFLSFLTRQPSELLDTIETVVQRAATAEGLKRFRSVLNLHVIG